MVVLSGHTRGSIYCVIGILSFGPDSLLLRQVAQVPNFTVLFYRYLFLGCTMLLFVLLRSGLDTVNSFRALGPIGAAAGVVWGLQNVCITLGFQLTSAANVLVILAANPVFAAGLSYCVLRETIKLRTALASLVCFGTIVLIVWSELSGSSSSGSGLIGILCAVGASVTTAVYFVLLRLCMVRNPGVDIDMMPCVVISGFVAMLVSLITQPSIQTDSVDPVDWVYIVLQGCVSLPMGSIFLTLGPALLPAPEVSLYTLFETVLGPLLVWLGGYEQPSLFSFIGGSALLLSLCVHNLIALREEQRMLKEMEGTSEAHSSLDADHVILVEELEHGGSGGDGGDDEQQQQKQQKQQGDDALLLVEATNPLKSNSDDDLRESIVVELGLLGDDRSSIGAAYALCAGGGRDGDGVGYGSGNIADPDLGDTSH